MKNRVFNREVLGRLGRSGAKTPAADGAQSPLDAPCKPLFVRIDAQACTGVTEANPYLRMPIDQVRSDARAGVRLAREGWRIRDSEGAAKELGRIVEPSALTGEPRGGQARIQAASGFQKKPQHLRHGRKSKASK
jgi:hypothetical protein